MRSGVFILGGILLAAPAYAACTKPDVPACATQRGAFAGESDFDQCRNQMLAYKGGMEILAACLKEEKKDDKPANDELEDVLAKFNRRARGE